MQTWIPSLPHVNSYLPPQRTNLNLGKWDTADYISAQVQLSLKCIPSWGPGYLNEALRVKISWEIGKWIIECDHYIIQSWKEILKWTQTGDIHFLINRDCAVMIVDIIDGFERCCSHSSNFPMYSLCIRPIFWSISLHLGLINLEHISFCIIGTIWSEESIHSHHPLSPLEIACEEIFSCVCYSNILAGHNTHNGQDSQIPPLSIPSQSYLSGDAPSSTPARYQDPISI